MKTPRVVRSAVLRAGARRHHLAEIRQLSEAPWTSPDEMDALRLARLAATVERAARTSPFYRSVFGTDVAVPRSFEDLRSLPVTSKLDMRASGLDRAAPGSALRWRGVWRTSGSSGQPYQFAIDPWYPHRHAAQRAYVYLAAGLQRGDPIFEIVAGADRVESPKMVYPTFSRTAVGYRRRDVTGALTEARPRLLYGSRSFLLQVADEVERAEGCLAVPFLCSSSEKLLVQDEARLEQVFCAPRIFEIYGSTEASNVAFRLPGQRDWSVLEPRIIVEVLDEDHQPVGPGEMGELVVTTLTEPTSPLIRYASGDLARVGSGSGTGASGLKLAALEGRSVDMFVTEEGKRVSFSPLASPSFWVSPQVALHVARYQVHQAADRSVRVALELHPGGKVEAVEDAIITHFKANLGALPVTIEVRDRIHDPEAGKFREATSDA